MPATVWNPRVERRDHPVGEAGVRSSLEEVARRAALGGSHPRVKEWAGEQIHDARLRGVGVKGGRARAEILLSAVQQQKTWVPDPVGTEYIKGAHLLACSKDDKDGPCFNTGDCFPEGTLVLRDGHELKPIEFLKAGDRIWGLGAWSTVEAVAYKGLLSVDAIRLNNGSDVRLTPRHKVAVLDCAEHPMLDDDEKDAQALPADRHWRGGGNDPTSGCSCDCSSRREKLTRVQELRRGMVLCQPERLPFGREENDPDLAWMDGVYAADGWCSHNNTFEISGLDGHPKEEQKKEVQRICERFGVRTRWHRKYISVKDGEWALRMQQMGTHAPQKRLLSINLGEAAAAATLRGVMADSGKNTYGSQRTFTSTSRMLTVQARVLHRMFGISCGYRYVANHGGLGQNAVHRLGTRGKSREDGRRPWFLRVKNIERDVFSVPCWDIQTSDHRVYLPEHDVTVQNCDDMTVLLAASFLSVGLNSMIVGHAYDSQRMIQHVLAAVRVGDQWLYADPSYDYPLGHCAPFTRERLLSVPNVKVVCDETACLTDPKKFDPDREGFVAKGYFVGVDGVPERSAEIWWIGPGRRA